MNNIESWDSMRHINLIIALEQEFDIYFPDEKITSLTSFQLLSMAVTQAVEHSQTK
jgi:acyl carrier protein